jgi:hypothetical protein
MCGCRDGGAPLFIALTFKCLELVMECGQAASDGVSSKWRCWSKLDANKQAGQWARLYRQVQAAEERLRQAEQDTEPASTEPSEYAKQQEESANAGGTVMTLVESLQTDERQEQLRTIASDLLYWKSGLKVLRQAQLPKWRGSFKWQIEAKIEALQQEYATLRAECAKSDV